MIRGEALLSLAGVTKRFGGVVALKEVDLAVPRGAIVGLIGPNGAGKTTVFNVITGAYAADAGAIHFRGRWLHGLPPYAITRLGMARTFQSIRLFRGMTVRDHVLVAQEMHVAPLSRWLPGAWGDRVSRDEAREILELTGLGEVGHLPAASLPYGMQRRVEIARALATRPSLLLLDEPVAGMNRGEAAAIRELLLRMRGRGLTILLIEHDMAFVMGVCDYLYVLDFGAVIAKGTPAEAQTHPQVIDAYLGEDLGA